MADPAKFKSVSVSVATYKVLKFLGAGKVTNADLTVSKIIEILAKKESKKHGYKNECIGTISLLTHLRTFGHIFNPVSFYFVNDASGKPLCSIAEVDNTFNEQKLFLVDQQENGSFKQDHRKLFYVSPYSDLDTIFHFNLRRPNRTLRLGINQSEKNSRNPFFRSALSGKSIPLTDKNLLAYSIRFPAITIGILLGIHWQALLLHFKGHRARRKLNNPELQTEKRAYLKPHQPPTF